jgi:ketosteroid isomerase-like protein
MDRSSHVRSTLTALGLLLLAGQGGCANDPIADDTETGEGVPLPARARLRPTEGSVASASHTLHPDCVDNAQPLLCTKLVGNLEAEWANLRQAFVAGDLEEITSYYSNPNGVTHFFGQFYRGHAAYEHDFLAPLYETITSADLDPSGTRYQMISRDVVVQYGVVNGTLTLHDGSTMLIAESAMLVWVRSHGQPGRPFVIAAEYSETL